MNKNTLDFITAIRNGKVTIDAGGSTASVRILTINHNPGEHITFECELLSGTPYNKMYRNPIPSIKNVIFNDPATIVQWSDGTKTIVKCGENDWYDPEKGLAMAISKKALGNQGNYFNEFRKWIDPYIKQNYVEIDMSSFDPSEYIRGIFKQFLGRPEDHLIVGDGTAQEEVEEPVPEEEPAPEPKWEIRYRNVELNTPEEFHDYAYSSKYSAERAARRMFGDPNIGRYRWYVKEI